jgi:hypothetical protein
LKTKRNILTTGLSLILIYCGCNNETKIDPVQEGQALTRKYCTSCHVYPEPGLLSKGIWDKNVLPAMGAFADLYKTKDGTYKMLTPEMSALFKNPSIAKVRASIPLQDWNKIVDFYLANAPDTLLSPTASITINNTQFSDPVMVKRSKSFTGFVHYDAPSKLLFQSAFADSSLNIFKYDGGVLKLVSSLTHCRGVVDVTPVAGEKAEQVSSFLVTHIGSFQPTDKRNGFVEQAGFKQGKAVYRQLLCDSLYRPVQCLQADMDNDGKEDIVVCEFGFMSGQLSLFKNMGNGQYKKQQLSSIAGAEKMYIEDINGDGLMDIWVLFAHDIEGIFQFVNKGNGQFEAKQILSFPPSYGSTYFQLADMDNDGQKEIIYTCGDNADYSKILKPYHGVYLFKNIKGNYKQEAFFHLNGSYKAMPADFNNDRKMDLAVISFFADYEHDPNEGFVWLENQGNNHFKAFTDSSIANKGRWICMDVQDLNGDKKPDVILGNMAAKPGNNRELMLQWMNGPEFVLLRSN